LYYVRVSTLYFFVIDENSYQIFRTESVLDGQKSLLRNGYIVLLYIFQSNLTNIHISYATKNIITKFYYLILLFYTHHIIENIKQLYQRIHHSVDERASRTLHLYNITNSST